MQAVQHVHAGMVAEAWGAAATGEGGHCDGGRYGERIEVVGLSEAQDQQAHQGGATERDKATMILAGKPQGTLQGRMAEWRRQHWNKPLNG